VAARDWQLEMQSGQVHREMRDMPADEERRCVNVWKAFDFFARDDKGIAAKKSPGRFRAGALSDYRISANNYLPGSFTSVNLSNSTL
jgi:hypothetical protein